MPPMSAKKVWVPAASASVGSPVRALMEWCGDHRSSEKPRHCNVSVCCVSNATVKRPDGLQEETDQTGRARNQEDDPDGLF